MNYTPPVKARVAVTANGLTYVEASLHDLVARMVMDGAVVMPLDSADVWIEINGDRYKVEPPEFWNYDG